MIQLATTNGYNQDIVKDFNKVSKSISDADMLDFILTKWADDADVQDITASLYALTFSDVDGNILSVGDLVVLLDDSELVDNPPKRGDVLQITALLDLDSNFIECGNHSLYAHRLLKVKKSF